ncbi:hypothetical protein D3C78_1701880 [compost metagenome]
MGRRGVLLHVAHFLELAQQAMGRGARDTELVSDLRHGQTSDVLDQQFKNRQGAVAD